ncbi:MAG: hypothetical protein HY788_23935 [Deltaproteobacteria bacterium]|nr:hypothetical protein [Deltaproteobacteria bacterium]
MKTELKEAVEQLHNCKAEWSESIPINETFQGHTVWEGKVQVFELSSHPKVKKCYVWSHPMEGSDKSKFYAILHQGPVDSPEACVRAAIVSEYGEK